MRYSTLIAFTSALLLLAGVPATGQSSKQLPDDRVSGTWQLVELRTSFLNENKVIMKEDELKDLIIIVEGDRLTAKEKGKTALTCKFTLQPKKNPKRVDLLAVVEDENEKKGPLLCIYTVQKDVLRVAFRFGVSRATAHPYLLPGAPRPQNFEPSELPTAVCSFKRVKD